MNKIIFVVGVGRCATSITSKIIHEHFGIPMGQHFRPSDKDNPQGYWEDLEFKLLNEKIIGGQITFPIFLDKIKKLIDIRNNTHQQWGLKDPRLSYLLGIYFSMVKNANIIWCYKEMDLVIKSLMKTYSWSESDAKQVYLDRTSRIDNLLTGRNHSIIDFTKFKTDKEIIKCLKQILYQ